MNAAHAALRAGTAAAHERLDALMVGFDLADRASYIQFLLAHADALGPVEAALDDLAAGVVSDWPERRRGARLIADLADLQQGPPGEGVPFPLASVFEAAGALYVLEGSRLGGKFLARQIGSGLPQAYLGERRPADDWPRLLDTLAAALPDQDARNEAIAAAQAVFARFETAARRRLDRNLCKDGDLA